jgi:hypothetical protein
MQKQSSNKKPKTKAKSKKQDEKQLAQIIIFNPNFYSPWKSLFDDEDDEW